MASPKQAFGTRFQSSQLFVRDPESGAYVCDSGHRRHFFSGRCLRPGRRVLRSQTRFSYGPWGSHGLTGRMVLVDPPGGGPDSWTLMVLWKQAKSLQKSTWDDISTTDVKTPKTQVKKFNKNIFGCFAPHFFKKKSGPALRPQILDLAGKRCWMAVPPPPARQGPLWLKKKTQDGSDFPFLFHWPRFQTWAVTTWGSNPKMVLSLCNKIEDFRVSSFQT